MRRQQLVHDNLSRIEQWTALPRRHELHRVEPSLPEAIAFWDRTDAFGCIGRARHCASATIRLLAWQLIPKANADRIKSWVVRWLEDNLERNNGLALLCATVNEILATKGE